MSHENSITIQGRNGKWVNIPTVINGKAVTGQKATDMYNKGQLKALDDMQFDDVDSAVNAAKKRSESFKEKDQ